MAAFKFLVVPVTLINIRYLILKIRQVEVGSSDYVMLKQRGKMNK